MKMMKTVLLAAVPAAILFSCSKNADIVTPEAADLSAGKAVTGNGAPSGTHYQVNIIGVPKGKKADMTNNDGRRIFVNLEGKSNIYLTEGDFNVIDANGTDQDGATFQLPAPDADCDGMTEYSVFARALGKPGGSATVRNCATYDGEVICEDLLDEEEVLNVERTAGRPIFDNVTRELLYIYVDITDDGVYNPKRYPIFDDRLENYFWEYDNSGLRVLQLRFYEVATSVESDCQ